MTIKLLKLLEEHVGSFYICLTILTLDIYLIISLIFTYKLNRSSNVIT